MAFDNLTILIVDDFMTMRRIIRNIVVGMQFKQILEAGDGKEAIEILKSRKVDVIVSDWNMPSMSGLEFLKWVRSNEATRDIPFLMVTAEAQKENLVEAIRAKVTKYIAKPFTPAALVERLEQILKD